MIINAIAIVLILVATFFILQKKISDKKKAEKQDKSGEIQVDDKTYTLDMMMKFVKRRLDEITKVNLFDLGLSEEELKRRKNKKNSARKGKVKRKKQR